jgi:hypothetical protein
MSTNRDSQRGLIDAQAMPLRWSAQGSYLFYFRDAAAARCQGVIPLEGARVAAARAGRAPGEPRVRIDLEPDPLLRHCTYTLAADSDDMQARDRDNKMLLSLCALAFIPAPRVCK